jgi:hypothetical protein
MCVITENASLLCVFEALHKKFRTEMGSTPQCRKGHIVDMPELKSVYNLQLPCHTF